MGRAELSLTRLLRDCQSPFTRDSPQPPAAPETFLEKEKETQAVPPPPSSSPPRGRFSSLRRFSRQKQKPVTKPTPGPSVSPRSSRPVERVDTGVGSALVGAERSVWLLDAAGRAGLVGQLHLTCRYTANHPNNPANKSQTPVETGPKTPIPPRDAQLTEALRRQVDTCTRTHTYRPPAAQAQEAKSKITDKTVSQPGAGGMAKG